LKEVNEYGIPMIVFDAGGVDGFDFNEITLVSHAAGNASTHHTIAEEPDTARKEVTTARRTKDSGRTKDSSSVAGSATSKKSAFREPAKDASPRVKDSARSKGDQSARGSARKEKPGSARKASARK